MASPAGPVAPAAFGDVPGLALDGGGGCGDSLFSPYVPNNPGGLVLDTSLWKSVDDGGGGAANPGDVPSVSEGHPEGLAGSDDLIPLRNVQAGYGFSQEDAANDGGFLVQSDASLSVAFDLTSSADLLGSSADLLNSGPLNPTSHGDHFQPPIEDASSYLPTSQLSLDEATACCNNNNNGDKGVGVPSSAGKERPEEPQQQQQTEDLLSPVVVDFGDLNFSTAGGDAFGNILVEPSRLIPTTAPSNNNPASTAGEGTSNTTAISESGMLLGGGGGSAAGGGNGGGNMADVLLSLKHAVVHPEDGGGGGQGWAASAQAGSVQGGGHDDGHGEDPATAAAAAAWMHHQHLMAEPPAASSSPSSFLHRGGAPHLGHANPGGGFPPIYPLEPAPAATSAPSSASPWVSGFTATAGSPHFYPDHSEFQPHHTHPPPQQQFSPTSQAFFSAAANAAASSATPPPLGSPGAAAYAGHDLFYGYHPGHPPHGGKEDSKEGLLIGADYGAAAGRSASILDAKRPAAASPRSVYSPNSHLCYEPGVGAHGHHHHHHVGGGSPGSPLGGGAISPLLGGVAAGHLAGHHTHPSSPDSSTDNTKNICGICGKTYARPSTLKTHLRTHSGERPYRCYSCNKSFSQAANLTAHCRTHSGEKPFHCSICNRKFSQSSSVTTHMRTHSGERPYRCRMCKKAFSDSSTLTKHLRIHSGEKPYQCKLCHLRFSQSGNLNRHMRIHAQNGS